MHQNFSECSHLCSSSLPDPHIPLGGQGSLRSPLGHQVCCVQAVLSEPIREERFLPWVGGWGGLC